MDKKQFAGVVIIGISVVALVAAMTIFFRSRPQDELKLVEQKSSRRTREQLVEVGGIKRPITDIRPNRPRSDPKSNKDFTNENIGTTPRVPADANPHVKSVAEALKTGKHPERVSPIILPKPFDQATYLANPDAYLNVVEPGRIWQVAQPGKGVPRLASSVDRFQTIEQGQSVTLKVKAIRDAPVTFTSFDLGAFQNRLTSITVKADANGNASAIFTGTPGTINKVSILAGSPMTSGQLKFIVDVQPARKTAPLQSQK